MSTVSILKCGECLEYFYINTNKGWQGFLSSCFDIRAIDVYDGLLSDFI